MTLVDALQAALAGEHAAVYAYGVVGGQLTGPSQQAAATTAYDTHRGRRASLSELIVANKAEPVPAATAYDVGRVTTAAQARALAATVEHGLAGAYADLVGATGATPSEQRPSDASLRMTAAAWLAESAVRAVSWGAEPQVFPGLTERTR